MFLTLHVPFFSLHGDPMTVDGVNNTCQPLTGNMWGCPDADNLLSADTCAVLPVRPSSRG